MFGIGGFELFLIVVFIFVAFGPQKMPEVTKYAGLAIRKFRKAKAEMDKVLQEEIVDPVMKVANEPEKPKKTSTKDAEKTPEKSPEKATPKQDKKGEK